jgi:membrane-associated protein
MRFRRFILFSVTGGVAWVNICVLSGYFFGGLDWVQHNFEMVLVAVVAISVMPMAVEFGLSWWRKRTGQSEAHSSPKDVTHLVANPSQPEAAARR